MGLTTLGNASFKVQIISDTIFQLIGSQNITLLASGRANRKFVARISIGKISINSAQTTMDILQLKGGVKHGFVGIIKSCCST